jgi:L-fuculose-phosphate aldolase
MGARWTSLFDISARFTFPRQDNTMTTALQERYAKEITAMVQACKIVAEKNFVTSHGGNLSCRVAPGTFLITPTKVPKGNIEFEDICIINDSGQALHASAGRRPTGEWPFHLGIFARRQDLGSLVHAHPPAITAMAIARCNLLERPILPEPVLEVGPVLPVQYEQPLSDELAEAFEPVVGKSNAWLMHNHGITLGSTEGILRAVELLEMIESTALSISLAKGLGPVHELSRHDVERLDNVIEIRNLPLPGAPGSVKSLVELYF